MRTPLYECVHVSPCFNSLTAGLHIVVCKINNGKNLDYRDSHENTLNLDDSDLNDKLSRETNTTTIRR